MNCFMTPTQTIGEKNDAALMELLDLSYRTGETGFLPGYLVGSDGKLSLDAKSAGTLSLGDGKHVFVMELDTDGTRRANALYGDILFNGTNGVRYPKAGTGSYGEVTGLRALTESREWARMTDEARMQAVSKAMKLAKEITSVQIAREMLK